MYNLVFGQGVLLFFSLVFIFMFGYGIRSNLSYALKISKLSDKMNLILTGGKELVADIKFTGSDEVPVANYGDIKIIAQEYKKGYDLFVFNQVTPGTVIPSHIHKLSNELILVIDGELEVCVNRKKDKKRGFEEGFIQTKKLLANDCIFIHKREQHIVSVIKPTKFVVITKPPLFTRIGKIYESLF